MFPERLTKAVNSDSRWLVEFVMKDLLMLQTEAEGMIWRKSRQKACLPGGSGRNMVCCIECICRIVAFLHRT